MRLPVGLEEPDAGEETETAGYGGEGAGNYEPGAGAAFGEGVVCSGMGICLCCLGCFEVGEGGVIERRDVGLGFYRLEFESGVVLEGDCEGVASHCELELMLELPERSQLNSS